MAGIIHPYYVVVLAPPIAALVGLGGAVAWRDRARLAGPAAPGGRRGGDGGVGVRAAAAHAVVAAVVGVDGAGARRGRRRWGCWWRSRAPRVLGAAVARGGRWRPGWRADRLRARHGRDAAHRSDPVGAGRRVARGRVGSAGAAPAAAGRRRPLGEGQAAPVLARRAAAGGSAAGATGGGMGRGGPGGFGGLLGSPTPSTQVVALLQRDAGEFTWAAAAVGSNTAAGYQLATQLPVMAVGGFNGTDPSPTLAQFQELVAAKKIHWFVAAARDPARSQSGGSDDAAEIAALGAAALHRRRPSAARPSTTCPERRRDARHPGGSHPQPAHRSTTRTRQRAPTSLSP